jgi:hypothetical protein
MRRTLKTPQNQDAGCTQDIIRDHCPHCSRKTRSIPRLIVLAIVDVPHRLRDSSQISLRTHARDDRHGRAGLFAPTL